ncbi:glycosyltransferase [Aestuariibacter sp. AA17]|uniref:Glycosyltransferase n=1 Tax=Fluctibacter corallii TaxID=2984329 RepID=A0ABT3AA11_9ALTE|nr:glycosyltransferase [Aestuariibacter sp. AA17]MCV2885528.1 glycosyltransferase [Aestuariibacter sp. AA17]
MIRDIVEEFKYWEARAGHDVRALQNVERELEQTADSGMSKSVAFLMFRNGFRVRHAEHMQIRRPKVLLGAICHNVYPNFQSIPLLAFCDLVSLSDAKNQQGLDERIFFDVFRDDFNDIVSRLPKGFTPDYYFDPQACGVSVPPAGIEESPFPTVAGICHTFRAVNTDMIARLYDVVLPVSKPFSALFSKSHPDKLVLDVPFGANWGSFHYTIKNDGVERDIDVLINFTDVVRPEYGEYRRQAIELAKAFKLKYGHRFTIHFAQKCNKQDYEKTIVCSKVVLNVCGFNGPYNYRTCEAMNAGAVLLQMDVKFDVEPQKMEDYFNEGEDYIAFNPDNFETTLLEILENPERRHAISQSAMAKMETMYSCVAIHQTILNAIHAEGPERLVARRARGFEQFQNWMRVLATSPAHHLYKHQLFGMLACGSSSFEDPDTIRYGIMGVTALERAMGRQGAGFIAHGALRQSFSNGYINAIEYLDAMFSEEERTLADTWFVACTRAQCGLPSTDDLMTVKSALEAAIRDQSLLISADSLCLLDFLTPVEESDTARKQILDIPYLLAAGDQEAQNQIVMEYMLWWTDYFIAKALDLQSELSA